MSIYKSKPKIIEAIEFEPLKPFNLPAEVKIKFLNTPEEVVYELFNKLHNSWIKIKPGDMIRIDNANDHYPIDKADFEENYLPVEC